MFIASDALVARQNVLLSTLPDEDLRHLLERLDVMELRLKQVLVERGQPIRHVYFPCTCVLSVLAYMKSGAAVEVGTIGKEGFLGIDLLAGSEIALDTTLCQVAGTSLRMKAADFNHAIAGDTPLRRITQRYLQAYLSLVSQSVACNQLHTIEERFSRWLLMTQDRAGSDSFDLTQEFIAEMLGVHRPSVSLVAGAFQQAGMIKYNRGHVTILDRQAMEEAACECYDNIAQNFRRLRN